MRAAAELIEVLQDIFHFTVSCEAVSSLAEEIWAERDGLKLFLGYDRDHVYSGRTIFNPLEDEKNVLFLYHFLEQKYNGALTLIIRKDSSSWKAQISITDVAGVTHFYSQKHAEMAPAVWQVMVDFGRRNRENN